jgi:tetratricopeptide (TPR) repeat protein
VRVWGRLVLEKTPLFLLAALSGVVTWTAQSGIGAVIPLEAIPLGSRFANAALSCWAYLGKTIFPARLAAYYPLAAPDLADAEVLLGICALAVATAAAIRCRSRAPYILVGWLWFLIGLAPVIGLAQVGEQAMADRYTYLPLVGPFVAIACGAARLGWPWRRSLLPWAAGATLLLLCGISWRQTAHWRDAESLFEHTLSVTEGNWFAHNNYAGALFARGEWERAVAHLEESLRIRPDYLKARLNLERALEEIQEARRTPDARRPSTEAGSR